METGSNRVLRGISYYCEVAGKSKFPLVLDFTPQTKQNPLTENLPNGIEKYSCSIMLNVVQRQLIHH